MTPTMKKIHVAACALLILIFSFLAFGQDTGRTAAATWQVQKYDLEVNLPADNSRSVPAKATISVKNVSGKPATSLTLRIMPLAEITSLKINNSVAEFTKAEEKINAASSLQRIVTRFPSVAADGVLTALIEYKVTLKENTPVGSVTPFVSQLLPLSFWYPTPNSWFFARAADAAPVRLKVTAPAGQTVVSSGTETAGTFEQKLNGQPFFAAGSWDISNQNGVSVYLPKGASSEGQKRAAELAALYSEARTFFTAMLGKAPDVPLRLVSVRRGAGFGSGGTVLVDEAVFRRSKVDSLTAMNIAESTVKLWLGNTVAVNGEGYGIISEGLCRYIATQFIENKFGKDVADIERLRQRNAYAAVSKRDAPMALVSPIDDYYYPEVANKGAMAWRLIAKRIGANEFGTLVRVGMQDGSLNVAELRSALAPHKDLVDYLLDQVTDMNLVIGLPIVTGAETKVNLRNTGAIDATVDIVGVAASGEKVTGSTTITAKSYGEYIFKSNARIVRVEIDPEKLYPQMEYADDVKPQETTDSDPLLAAKRFFDKQDFVNTEKTARSLLRDFPRLDDLRVLLGRALLAQNKNAEADKEFRSVLDEKLPTARSLAWANVGLAEVASKSNQNEAALKYAETAIAADAEYGASFSARNLRNKLGFVSPADASVRTFFADFDKAASSNRKADVDALAMPGEITRFVGGLSGSTEQWQTQIRQIDRIDANTVLVEANMTVKLLNKNVETGLAVYRLTKAGAGWKLSGVDMFEVR